MNRTKISPELEFVCHRPHPWVPTRQNMAVCRVKKSTNRCGPGRRGSRPRLHIRQQISNAAVSSASSTPVGKSAHAV